MLQLAAFHCCLIGCNGVLFVQASFQWVLQYLHSTEYMADHHNSGTLVFDSNGFTKLNNPLLCEDVGVAALCTWCCSCKCSLIALLLPLLDFIFTLQVFVFELGQLSDEVSLSSAVTLQLCFHLPGLANCYSGFALQLHCNCSMLQRSSKHNFDENAPVLQCKNGCLVYANTSIGACAFTLTLIAGLDPLDKMVSAHKHNAPCCIPYPWLCCWCLPRSGC